MSKALRKICTKSRIQNNVMNLVARMVNMQLIQNIKIMINQYMGKYFE